ncbi:hypothetical protein LWI29_031438 [Acer saccharum]|uniref:Uncharacterized protein n=1 Tax=Acer saccharum TaxID=4024 RepID=A0AA39SAT9_ACESA|nr:hypothetical protein LWI29_031438 [Acer saccharum]
MSDIWAVGGVGDGGGGGLWLIWGGGRRYGINGWVFVANDGASFVMGFVVMMMLLQLLQFSSNQPATGATIGFTFGGCPLPLNGPVRAIAGAEVGSGLYLVRF